MKRIYMAALVCALMIAPSHAQTPEASEHEQLTIATNARHLLPPAQSGDVAVVVHSTPVSEGFIGIVIMNGTNETVAIHQVKAEIRTGDGDLAGVATAPGGAFINPDVLAPGDIASGRMYLENIVLPANYSIEFTVETREPDRINELAPAMEFDGVEWTGTAMVGNIVNPSDMDVSIVNFSMVCLDDDGSISGFDIDFQVITLAPGESTTFQTSPLGGETCENFILGGNSA